MCPFPEENQQPVLGGSAPVFVGLEAEAGVPVKQVTEEIVDCVGQWEKIVDAPVLLRSLDAELGDRFLQDLEQIVEVLKVLPEQIASQLKGSGGMRSACPSAQGSRLSTCPSAGHGVCRDAVGVRRGADDGIPCASVFGGARAESCVAEQIMEFPVPRIMEAAVEVVPSTPQERVQNRPRKLFVDVPVPHIKEKIAGKVMRTGKVFTVPHHRDDQACTFDTVGLHIKGLDKFNLLRVGDVMVPAPQITKGVVGHVEQVVSWFDGKSQVAADEPLYRF